MEKLADKGNGHYAYIDSIAGSTQGPRREAGGDAGHDRQGRQAAGRVQPGPVASLSPDRLREPAVGKEDFNDDKKDAGDMGAGHTVTALYEIVPQR